MPARVTTPIHPATTDLSGQVDRLVALGAPALAGLSDRAFRDVLGPLRDVAEPTEPSAPHRLPFVLALHPTLVRPEALLPRITLHDRRAFTSMIDEDLASFHPVTDPVEGHAVGVPGVPAYLVTDVDTGADLRGVPPQDAWGPIVRSNRSPLTLEEGVAVLAQHPDILRSHSCFSMLGSRCGDRRVTALWLSKQHPRLGWCWTGAPHTWLGSASCATRVN